MKTKIPVTKTKTVTEVFKYKISPSIRMDITFVNGKQTEKNLTYIGPKRKCEYDGKNIPMFPLYDADMEYLKTKNPFHCLQVEVWWDNCGKNFVNLNPEDIDIKKIILCCSYDHTLWTLEGEQIPIPEYGDYIDAGLTSKKYNLKDLHAYLKNHKQTVSITDIEKIPWYNNETGNEKCFSIYVLPTKQQLKKLKRGKDIFTDPQDFLGIAKFKRKEKEK
jgi:hypothetical protein